MRGYRAGDGGEEDLERADIDDFNVDDSTAAEDQRDRDIPVGACLTITAPCFRVR